jgi:hypothetical protein
MIWLGILWGVLGVEYTVEKVRVWAIIWEKKNFWVGGF